MVRTPSAGRPLPAVTLRADGVMAACVRGAGVSGDWVRAAGGVVPLAGAEEACGCGSRAGADGLSARANREREEAVAFGTPAATGSGANAGAGAACGWGVDSAGRENRDAAGAGSGVLAIAGTSTVAGTREAVGRVTAVIVTSVTPSVLPIRARTAFWGGIADRRAANWSAVWMGWPSIASRTSCGRIPTAWAGPGSATSTITSRPVTRESSTVSPSQPVVGLLVGLAGLARRFFVLSSATVTSGGAGVAGGSEAGAAASAGGGSGGSVSPSPAGSVSAAGVVGRLADVSGICSGSPTAMSVDESRPAEDAAVARGSRASAGSAAPTERLLPVSSVITSSQPQRHEHCHAVRCTAAQLKENVERVTKKSCGGCISQRARDRPPDFRIDRQRGLACVTLSIRHRRPVASGRVAVHRFSTSRYGTVQTGISTVARVCLRLFDSTASTPILARREGGGDRFGQIQRANWLPPPVTIAGRLSCDLARARQEDRNRIESPEFPGHGVSQNVSNLSNRRQTCSQPSGGGRTRAGRPQRATTGRLRRLGEVAADSDLTPAASPAQVPSGGRSSGQPPKPQEQPSCPAAAILDGLREHLGSERFAVWFGEACRVEVGAGRDGSQHVTLYHDPGFAGDWLRKTFHADLQAVAEQYCGGPVVLAWQPLAAPTGPSVGESPQPSSRKAAASRRRTPEVTGAGGSGAQPARRSERRSTAAAGPAGGLPGRQPVRLEDFVVGTSNRMAYAAVELAVNRLGEMSPVLLHGPSGVGKSHLLAAIHGKAREVRPGMSALMLSAEQFTTNFLQALQGKGLPGFRRSCRSVDLLVVDDLQFFIGKRATLLELQSTVDTLHRAGKQIIFASDRDLESLSELGSELTGRIRGGMTAAVMPPDGEVRRGIVAGLAARRQLALPPEVVTYLADHLTRHARELIGGVNRLEAASHMLGVPITLELAQESLVDLIRSSSRSLRLADIERAVCTAFGIGDAELQSARRSRAVNHPRMLAMFLARKHTGAALTEIGRYFGRRSHSTVISAEKTVRKWLQSQAPVVLADASWDIDQAIRRVEDVLRAG